MNKDEWILTGRLGLSKQNLYRHYFFTQGGLCHYCLNTEIRFKNGRKLKDWEIPPKFKSTKKTRRLYYNPKDVKPYLPKEMLVCPTE